METIGPDTRERILRAAGLLFGRAGYELVTISEIVECSGVPRTAVYRHFPSKEAIADAVIAVQDEALVPREDGFRLQAAIDLSMSFADMLRHDPMMRGAVRLAVEQAVYRKPRATPYLGSHAVTLRLLEEARDGGELLPHVNPEEVTRLVVGLFTGLQILSEAAGGRTDLLDRVSFLWKSLLPGIAVPTLIPHLDTSPRHGLRPAATPAACAPGPGRC
ncbi:ScbR family autoregulator-binding transcription factor [Streptomyces sp. ICBB 8177]|uniref:ScbR family autoregulator-binding transcription factor n=1 Tax=Streptomyces sp. ICBB 8177 TaxID=563922 RepID=UPI0018EEA49F|nr:ScbR family autoregulator-binding transcription factor [Streptomyces sp. ICBB 8177]